MRVVRHYCQWPSFVGIFVICIGGCNHAPVQSQSATAPQSQAEQSRDKQRIPNGPVKIVNRKTGLALRGDAAKRIERAGEYWKIRLGESDKFLALAGWATKPEYAAKPPEGRHRSFLYGAQDSDTALTLWDIKPLGGGFWSIASRATGKFLEMRDEKPVLWQSQFREGDTKQHWRLEPVKSGTATGAKSDDSDTTSTQGRVPVKRPPLPVSPERFSSRDSEHVKKGIAAGLRDDWDLAQREFTAAIEFNGRDAKAYCGRAWAYLECAWQKGSDPSNLSIDPIIEDCSKANQLDPTDPDAFFVRGSAWLTALWPDRAISPLTEAIRLDPKNPSYYCMRAYANAWISRKDACRVAPTAVEDCSEAIRVDSNYAIAYVCRGWHLDLSGRKGEARADYDKALNMRQTKVQPDTLKLWIKVGFTPAWQPHFIAEEVTRGLFYHSANRF